MFGGSVADMIARMKQNRDLLKKKHYFKDHPNAGDYVGFDHRVSLSEKKATKKQLQKIREEVLEDQKKMVIKKVTILFISLMVLLAIIFFIRNLLNLSWIT